MKNVVTSLEISGVVLGLFVLFSYCIYTPSAKNQHALWAGLNDPCMFKIWCVTASTSVFAFLFFFARLITANDETMLNPWYETTLWPLTVFLASAALYMPVATRGFRYATIALLAITAASAWLILACSVEVFGWNVESAFLLVLAFHCTAIDLIYWGWTWWVGIDQPFEVVLHSQPHNGDIKAVVVNM
jgi:hypothetical protein